MDRIDDITKLNNILNNTNYGKKVLNDNIDYFINKGDNYVSYISSYLLSNYSDNKELIKYISTYDDSHIRFIFIKNLINYYESFINDIYDNIIDSCKSMNLDDISDIAIVFLKNNRIKEYNELKKYIVKGKNNLSSKLLKNGFKDRFINDSDKLFESSNDYKFEIYKNYSNYIKKDLIKNFESKIKYFDNDVKLNNIYKNGIGNYLEEFVDKYLSLSKTDSYELLGIGSTSSVYRIGDYVFKLIKSKWSYEDVICPNLFLINKNLEQIYLRDKNNIVKAGLEVQKYLINKASNIDKKYFDYFLKDLDNMGYFYNDTLINGSTGDNVMLLDSYLDADTKDHVSLPDWFKKVPLVLIDRDRIYNKNNMIIKQIDHR